MEELKSQTVPFLKLPPEIRNQIYRYLLCIKYTKHQSQSQVSIQNPYKEKIRLTPLSKPQGVIVPLLWPTYKYRFYTSIFGTNHQIQHESKHLARHENRFILIRSKSTFWMDVVCRNAGISCVCRGARELSHLVMDVELGWANLSLDPSGHTFEYLICCEQLSPFCEGTYFGVNHSCLIAKWSRMSSIRSRKLLYSSDLSCYSGETPHFSSWRIFVLSRFASLFLGLTSKKRH